MKCILRFDASHKSEFQIIHKSYCDCIALVRSEQISQAVLKALIFIGVTQTTDILAARHTKKVQEALKMSVRLKLCDSVCKKFIKEFFRRKFIF